MDVAVRSRPWAPSGSGRWRARGPTSSSPRARATIAPRLVGPSCIVASCLSLQTAAALATTVFGVFGPLGTGALRFAAAGVLLLAWTRPRLVGQTASWWVTLGALGAAMAAMNFCLYEAIARIPLGTAVTLEFLGPLALAVLGTRSRLDLLPTLAAAAGVALLAGTLSADSMLGVGFAVGAAASCAACLVLARHAGTGGGGLDGLALSVAAAALLTLPVAVPAAVSATGLSDLAIVSAVGLLGIAVPYGLEYSALRRLPVRTVSVLLSLDPAIAGLVGLMLLGQHLTIGECGGIGLVVTAGAAVVVRAPPS